ncbi:MAG: hypothetical protein PHR94_14780 [Methylomonas lenta]|nr:hypothetical protein [Methylomonas lenta]
MITLKDCLLQTKWTDVNTALVRWYPEHSQLMSSFHEAFEELMRTEPTVSTIRFVIGRYAPNSVLPFYVVGFKGDCPKGIGLKFLAWHQWLGAKIDASLHDNFSNAEIVAICLQDMAWAGFCSDEVQTFRREFIQHEECLWAIFSYEEDIGASELDLIKRKQRSVEFNESLNLYDFDRILPEGPSSTAYRHALFDLEVQIYCLGETETNFEDYSAKVADLREGFQIRWPKASQSRALVH